MLIENLSTLKIHTLTEEQFKKAKTAGNIIGNEMYLTPADDKVVGEYANPSANAVFTVGNGTSESKRSNAFEVISTNSGVSFKFGSTVITESQLQQLLAILTNNLAEGEY